MYGYEFLSMKPNYCPNYTGPVQFDMYSATVEVNSNKIDESI